MCEIQYTAFLSPGQSGRSVISATYLYRLPGLRMNEVTPQFFLFNFRCG